MYPSKTTDYAASLMHPPPLEGKSFFPYVRRPPHASPRPGRRTRMRVIKVPTVEMHRTANITHWHRNEVLRHAQSLLRRRHPCVPTFSCPASTVRSEILQMKCRTQQSIVVGARCQAHFDIKLWARAANATVAQAKLRKYAGARNRLAYAAQVEGMPPV